MQRRELLKTAAMDSIIYALIMGVSTFYFAVRQQELRADGQRLQELYEKAHVRLADVEGHLEKAKAEIRNENARIRLLLLARMSDYSRELEFWRDTIRRLMYAHVPNKATLEELLNDISASLKTFSTRADSNALNFNTITTMAGMLNSSELARSRGVEREARPEDATTARAVTGTT